MLKKSVLLFFTFISLCAFSQTKTEEEDYVNDNVLKYDDVNYKPNIKTVQIHESTWEYAIPAIDFNSNQAIELSFDDIEGDQKQYSITFQHCNADWTPSDLMISEYLSGFFDLNIINFNFSMNTLQKYTHYSILFPQQNLKFTKSGNYIVYVYVNGDKKDLVLSRRFMVFDNKVTVAHTFRQSNDGDDQFNKQHIDFTIYHSGYDITNPYSDMKVVLTQNNRWDNAVTNIKPTFMGGNQLTFYTERVKEIYRDENLKNHVVLYPDENRAVKPYLFYNDFNGAFVIKNRDAIGNQDTEADYVYVDFFLPYPTPESSGNFYVMGKLTDWRMNKKSKMVYNYKRYGYEAQLYLKQGFYNYVYVLSSDTKKGGDETMIEGNHWDTENDYAVYVYHRKIGTYYDQLICYKKINSMKK
ncbi:MAG: hypothetical protein K0S12_1666 [Bacteroidetes bacterium]|nr:hypothetical protein [Bacteroidota bacterium]